MCYSYRFKTADGSYKLFLHQALIINTDEDGKLAHTLNIHTDINHLTTENNYKMHFIGLKGQPSFMNLSYNDAILAIKPTYTNRELEVIKMLSLGKSTQTIAGELIITFSTVKNHRRNI